MALDILPSSRLKDPTKKSFLGDWKLPDGTIVRIMIEPVYCANCGKLYGHAPSENMADCFWLCRKCHETYGDIAGTFAKSDDQFIADVHHEMIERFGRVLTELEIVKLHDDGKLGPALEALIKDSPYPTPSSTTR